MNEIRLNIGAGETTIPGFTSIDAKLGHDALNLVYPDNSVDHVYSSHCLEHIHHSKTIDALTEWVRVLKPGGKIQIAVPDIEKVLAVHRAEPELYDWKFVSAWLHGTFDDPNDTHRAEFTYQALETMLRGLGIENIQPFDGWFDDQAKHNQFTLNIEGTKRKVAIPSEPSVALIMSEPRFGPLDTYKCIVDICRETGWPYLPMGGTEWGKGMEAAMEKVGRELAPDYVITLDYDGAFCADDFRKLVEFMQKRPDVMAAWPAQMHRHMDLPLGMNPDGAAHGVYGEEDDDGFVRMWSGHFGCTIIRRQAFESLPHPWFWSLPDPVTGDWKNGSDADITFWRSMHNFGMKFGQLNTVMIGHGEWCYKWPTVKPNGEAATIWQPIQHYRKHGRPKEAKFDFLAWVNRTRIAKGLGALTKSVLGKDKIQTYNVPEVAHESPKPELVHANGGV